MNKTKVDDMCIETISPKVKEIEERLGNGEGLRGAFLTLSKVIDKF